MAAFDRPERTFRHEAVPTYKANRDEAPDILRQQMGLVREVVDALGIVAVDLAGFEADDIIATLAERAKERATTSSSSPATATRTSWSRTRTSRCSTTAEACRTTRSTTRPASRSARGSPRRSTRSTPPCGATRATTCPGVPGVGEKTAAKLITTYGGIDGIYEHLDAQTPKLRASLAEHEERVRENARVMVLLRDVPVEVDLDAAVLEPKMAEVKRLFEFLEFRSLLDRLNEALGAKGVVAPWRGGAGASRPRWSAPASVAEAESLLGRLDRFDVAPAWAGVAGRSAARRPGRRARRRRRRRWRGCRPRWSPTPRSSARWPTAGRCGPTRPSRCCGPWPRSAPTCPRSRMDTAIAAYLLDPAETRYGVGDLLERYTGDRLPEEGTPAGQLDFAEEGADEAQVAAREALAVSRLAPALAAALEAQGMAALVREIENPLVRVLARMEDVGIARRPGRARGAQHPPHRGDAAGWPSSSGRSSAGTST